MGLTTRAPFYLVGLIALSLWAVCYGALGALWFFLVQPILWGLLGIPAAFFSVSFKGNGIEQFKARVQGEVSGWKTNYRRYFGAVGRTYDDLQRWFIEGSGRR